MNWFEGLAKSVDERGSYLLQQSSRISDMKFRNPGNNPKRIDDPLWADNTVGYPIGKISVYGIKSISEWEFY
jgi:hypothetical protein